MRLELVAAKVRLKHESPNEDFRQFSEIKEKYNKKKSCNKLLLS